MKECEHEWYPDAIFRDEDEIWLSLTCGECGDVKIRLGDWVGED